MTSVVVSGRRWDLPLVAFSWWASCPSRHSLNFSEAAVQVPQLSRCLCHTCALSHTCAPPESAAIVLALWSMAVLERSPG